MRVWVDCTAAAHPLVLRPLIAGLRARGDDVHVTARAYGQTLGILQRLGIEHTAVGRHAGRAAPAKGVALARRSAALWRWARPMRFDLGLGHGSVDLAVVGSLLRVPTVQMQDYEHAGLQRQLAFRAARRVLAPDAIPVEAMVRAGASEAKLFRYPGLKEDYYLADFVPDPRALDALGLDRVGLVAVVRPPPETSAYHAQNPLYDRVIERLLSEPGAQTVVVPRTERQAQALAARGQGSPGRLVVPGEAIDAQSLIAHADLVVSAGGTMNREAVALGTPVYTIFTGRMGAVDRGLIDAGLLRPLEDPDAIELAKRSGPVGVRSPRDPQLLLDAVLGAVT